MCLPQPCNRGPTRGRNCYVAPPFSGVPNKGGRIRRGFLTPALLRAHKRAELLRNPCNLGGPQQGGQIQKWLPHHCLVEGTQNGGDMLHNPHILGDPKHGGEITCSYLTLAFSAPKRGR